MPFRYGPRRAGTGDRGAQGWRQGLGPGEVAADSPRAQRGLRGSRPLPRPSAGRKEMQGEKTETQTSPGPEEEQHRLFLVTEGRFPWSVPGAACGGRNTGYTFGEGAARHRGRVLGGSKVHTEHGPYISVHAPPPAPQHAAPSSTPHPSPGRCHVGESKSPVWSHTGQPQPRHLRRLPHHEVPVGRGLAG